jgi:ParB-like chromosome segregation protein Spo0J
MAQGNGQAVLIAGGWGPARPHHGEPAPSGRLDLNHVEQLPARDVPVAALAPGPHLRQGGTSAAHVQLLIDAAGTTQLPPILVQEDGWRVIDGAHRLQAARLRGDHSIRARFLDCTDAEALVVAMTANTAHGLPLSRADRAAGARRVLTAHPDWSDRALAGITGLSAKTIASLRTGPAAGPHPGAKRLGRDGRRRPVTADEGRHRAAEYISTHPDAPLRQVARETDVSLGTVHDVSARLRRGISPQRNGHRAPAARLAIHPPAQPSAPAPHAGPAPAPGRTTPPRRKNHADTPPTWDQVAAKVANDPAIRYTQSGKEFLRWMTLHAADPGRWRQFLTTIPPHWLSVIAPIADTISAEWTQFAEQLKTTHETAR